MLFRSVRVVYNHPFPVAAGNYSTTGKSASMFFSQFFTGDTEMIFVPQELRTIYIEPKTVFDDIVMAVEAEVTTMSAYSDESVTRYMAVEVEDQIMYVPSKDFTAEDPVHTDIGPEPRQRALV